MTYDDVFADAPQIRLKTTRKAGKFVPLAAESFAKLERQH